MNIRLSEAVPIRPFFEQKLAENEDKNTNKLENNGSYSSISLVSVIQILASAKKWIGNVLICRISSRVVPKFYICHENKCIFSLLSETPLHTLIREANFT